MTVANGKNSFPLEARALLYAVLAASLRSEPSAAMLTELRDQVSSANKRMSEWPEPALGRSVGRLLKAIAPAVPEDLAVDYADLFLTGKIDLSPSESAYLEKTVYGEATLDVIESYACFGFVKEDSFTEPHDHIALECAFMAALSVELLDWAGSNSRAQLKSLILAQSDFVELHLGRWVPEWAKKVEEAAATDFYKAIAGLAVSLIEADGDLLAQLSEGVASVRPDM